VEKVRFESGVKEIRSDSDSAGDSGDAGENGCLA